MRTHYRLFLPIIAALILLSACQTTPPPSYMELDERVRAGERVDAAEFRRAFVADPGFPERLSRLMELEEQALAIMEDEPLKLGSIGSAILEQFHGSLTGHFAMLRFYEHVDSEDAAAPHRQWLESISEAMDPSDASADAPYSALTRSEARAHLLISGLEPVGGIYQRSDEHPFMLLLIGKPEEGRLARHYYDVEPMYLAMTHDMEPITDTENRPFALISSLARQSDTAAQAAVGALLSRNNRLEDAVGWLRASSRSGNVVANTLLARMFYEASTSEEDENERDQLLSEALDNYVHAIALGSSDAMYALAILYLSNVYGEENADAGYALLERAAKLDHSDAILSQAQLYDSGEHYEKSPEQAAALFIRASELRNPRAPGAYARFLMTTPDVEADARVHEWLRADAEREDAQAMLLLGNLHARGVAVPADTKRALDWFRQAVKVNPGDANITNEVAWTLAVSDIETLRQPRYAKKIMDGVMNVDEQARMRPEYLDTWAATHAANGEFERAIELQEQALSHAKAQGREDVLSILETHLEKFRAGEVIIERAP